MIEVGERMMMIMIIKKCWKNFLDCIIFKLFLLFFKIIVQLFSAATDEGIDHQYYF